MEPATTKTVLACVVQWDDCGVSRTEIAGWSDCPEQREQIKQHAIKNAVGNHIELLEAIQFMEIEIPLVPPGIDPTNIKEV